MSDSAVRILHGRILPGDRLGHFELVQYVGGGGMGRVFRAIDTRLARTVALKILSPEQAADRETVLRFQNEAQSAARLDHDNIARVYYVGEDRGLHYIVFEFVEGVNVRDLVETKGPLPLAEAVSYTLQVADALAHAAGRNVVHRDIKPSNLLITPDGQVKLIDMGLARLRETDAAGADLTASGVTLGTFDYISPEQARDPRNADVRSDIYSLGCTFFFMLTGRPPFLGGTMLQKLLQHQGDQPPDVRQFRPELPRRRDPRVAEDAGQGPAAPLSRSGRVGGRPAGAGQRRGLAPRGGRQPGLGGAGGAPSARGSIGICPGWRRLAALVAIVVGLELFWSHASGPESPPPPAVTPDVPDATLGEPAAMPRSGRRGAGRLPAKPAGRDALASMPNAAPPMSAAGCEPPQAVSRRQVSPPAIAPRQARLRGRWPSLRRPPPNAAGRAGGQPAAARQRRIRHAGSRLRRGRQRRRDRVALQRPARRTADQADQPPRADPRGRRLSAGRRLPAHGDRSGQVARGACWP